MIFLAFSILTSALLFFVFKWFDIRGVDNRQAIVVNYFAAFITGLLVHPEYLSAEPWAADWRWMALILGILFISLFNVLGLTAQRISVSVASVANKMSVAVPVGIAFWLYDDAITVGKIAGILTALLGVWLTSRPSSNLRIETNDYWLPLVLFMGSGLIDTLIKYVQHHYLTSDVAMLTFIPSIFLVAGVLGLIYLFFTNNIRFTRKNLIWGIVLGVPNYFSIYLIIKALEQSGFQSSVLFPINNIGVVIVSVLGGRLLFGEKLSTGSAIGIGVSVFGIVLLSWFA
ncbi:MAG: EamA/RhaT family transporter [Salibacteraceae bacterium]